MPIWAPPTPPDDEAAEDAAHLYTDYTLALVYDLDVMDVSQLPPIYVPRRNEEDGHVQKKRRLDPSAIAAAWKVYGAETSELRGMRERPVPPPMLYCRKGLDSDGKARRQGPLPSNKKLKLKIPNILSSRGDAGDEAEWTVCEDWALLQSVAAIQELNLGLQVEQGGHTPNWGMVADVVNAQSSLYKSPRQCRDRYLNVIALREEGKLPDDYLKKLKKMKVLSHIKVNRNAKTHVQVSQDKGMSETDLKSTRFDVIRSTSMKRTAIVKPSHGGNHATGSQQTVLEKSGVSMDLPIRSSDLAVQRTERITREKISAVNSNSNTREAQPQQTIGAGQHTYKGQERPTSVSVSGAQLTTLLSRNPIPQSVTQMGVPHQIAGLPAGAVSIAATNVTVQGTAAFIKRVAIPGQVVNVKQSLPGGTMALHHPSQSSQIIHQQPIVAKQQLPDDFKVCLAIPEERQKVTRPQTEAGVVSATQTHAQKLIGQTVSQSGIASSASMVTGPGQLATLVPSQPQRTLHQSQITGLPRMSHGTVRQLSTPLALQLVQRHPIQKGQLQQQLPPMQQLKRVQQHAALASGGQRFVTTVQQATSQIPVSQVVSQQPSQEQLQAKLLQGSLRQTPSPIPQQLTIQGKPMARPPSLPTPTQAVAVTQEGFQPNTQSLVRTLNQPHPQQQLLSPQQQQVLVRVRQQYPAHVQSLSQRLQQPIQQQPMQVSRTSATPPAPATQQGEGDRMLPPQTGQVTPEGRPPSASGQPQVQSPGQPKQLPVSQQGQAQAQAQTRQPYSMRPRHPSRSS